MTINVIEILYGLINQRWLSRKYVCIRPPQKSGYRLPHIDEQSAISGDTAGGFCHKILGMLRVNTGQGF